MATVEELTYDLNFEWDKKAFDDFSKSIGGIVKGFAKLTGVIVAAQAAGFGIAKSVADSNDELAKQAKRLNLSTQELQKFKFAASIGGASAEDLTSSLKNLTNAKEDALRGKGDLEAFGQLGIDPTSFKTSSELLLAVSDSISKIQSDSEKIRLLDRIGVSSNLLQTLEGGRKEIEKLGAEFEALGGISTEKQLKDAQDFNDALTKVGVVVGALKNNIGSSLIEPFKDFIDVFVEFSRKHMKDVISGFKKLFSVIGQVTNVIFGVLKRIFTTVLDIVDLFGGFENVIMAAGAAFLFLQRRMLLTFAIPLTIATALFLIVEDIVKGLKGQDSVTKDILNSTGLLGDAFRGIVNVLGEAAKGWDFFFTKGDKALGGLKILINDLIELINKIPFVEIEKLGGVPTAAKTSVGAKITQADIEAGRARGVSEQELAKIIQSAGGKSALAPNVTINVNGALDPKAVGEEVNKIFQKKANANFGGAR